MSDATKTLLHPFENGVLDFPEGGRVLALNALEPLLRSLDAPSVDAVQDFRPEFLKLIDARCHVTPEIEGVSYAMALVLCGRHRRLNEHLILQANERTATGGLVVVAGLKTDGAHSLRKRVKDRFEIEGQAAKHHGIVFWFRADGRPAPTLNAVVVDGRFKTSPGMFSHDRMDPGSMLLVAHLPEDVCGAVADLGAGWGYLAANVAEHSSKVDKVDLFEAGFSAACAARRNMAVLAPQMTSTTHWFDVTREDPDERYDWVVMNPPFHTGRGSNPAVGIAMIDAAWRYLKPGGKLVMVANQHLPYETALQRFAAKSEIVREQGYKILAARR